MYFSGVNPIKAFIRDPRFAWDFFVKSGVQVTISKIFNRKLRLRFYADRQVIQSETGNVLLHNRITSGIPFMAGRLGSNELLIFSEGWMHRKGIISQIRLDRLSKSFCGCGLFPMDDITVKKFTDEMILANQDCDFTGVWYNIFEEFVCEKFLPSDALLTHRRIFDFWLYEKPFTHALKGRKILVIHPLAEKIQSQYLKREELFGNPNILPEFDLKTIKAVQTIAGERDNRFNNWFEALDFMFEEAMKTDFEIALIGCGAYGFPLAAKLKRAGKIAIHMGGVTQMLFGIKGTRWDVNPEASNLYNEYWTRPEGNEIPRNAILVEDSCYW